MDTNFFINSVVLLHLPTIYQFVASYSTLVRCLFSWYCCYKWPLCDVWSASRIPSFFSSLPEVDMVLVRLDNLESKE